MNDVTNNSTRTVSHAIFISFVPSHFLRHVKRSDTAAMVNHTGAPVTQIISRLPERNTYTTLFSVAGVNVYQVYHADKDGIHTSCPASHGVTAWPLCLVLSDLQELTCRGIVVVCYEVLRVLRVLKLGMSGGSGVDLDVGGWEDIQTLCQRMEKCWNGVLRVGEMQFEGEGRVYAGMWDCVDIEGEDFKHGCAIE